MSKSGIKGLEESLKLNKKKAEKAVEQIIYKNVDKIVGAMVEQAIEGNYQHGSYLLDRAFGKARQNIGIDGGSEGSPIVFMPSALVNKFNLDKPIELEKIEEPNIYGEDPI